ncbi:MAG: methyl-accepting chemotaxis protein [Treponema sp.]|nr:methyl-accepting chemotaxis protein [Treponema sp.]
MKLSFRIPLLIGAVVVITAASIIITAVFIASGNLEEANYNELSAEAFANAELIIAKLENQKIQLWEIANRSRTRSMDWEGVVKQNLAPDVDRIDSLEMGLVYPDGEAHYVRDPQVTNLGDRDYVIRAFTGENAVSDVLISRALNKPVVMFASPVFENDTKGANVIGVVISRKDGTFLSGMTNQIKPSKKSGYAFMTNNEGTIIAHPNGELVLNQFSPIKDVKSDPSLKSLADMLSTAITEKSGSASYTINGENRICCYSEVPGLPWTLFVSIEKKDFEDEISQMRNIILAIGAICTLAGIGVAIPIGRSIAKPVIRIAGTLKDISEGEGDLTRSIIINTKDEFGNLAHYFNQTLEKIKNLVLNIRKEAGVLSRIGNDLSSNMNETAAAVNEITANIQSIKGRILNQSASVTETNATMEHVVANINKLDGLVDKQSTTVSQASGAIEEMAANIQSVTLTLANNSANVNTLLEASEVGRNGLQEVAGDIQEISRESEGLMEINSVMQNIASQTNLLSMNAAIEAAHAGESGKGFAVVADEIRKLAESSGKQSKTIGVVLKKIKSSIDKIMKSTENVLTKFEAIDTSVKVVTDQEEQIRGSMDEQGAKSKQIVEGVVGVNEITHQVRTSSHEMLDGSTEVIRGSTELDKQTQEIASGINEMAIGAEEMNVAIHHVNELSIKNRESIDVLMKEVGRFKVD